jgi:hypothetical protein
MLHWKKRSYTLAVETLFYAFGLQLTTVIVSITIPNGIESKGISLYTTFYRRVLGRNEVFIVCDNTIRNFAVGIFVCVIQ